MREPLALMRQAHPGLSPARLVGILRSTGKPIADPRNGITTPRIDTLAAVSFRERSAPSSAPRRRFPTASGSAIATVTISGYTGRSPASRSSSRSITTIRGSSA